MEDISFLPLSFFSRAVFFLSLSDFFFDFSFVSASGCSVSSVSKPMPLSGSNSKSEKSVGAIYRVNGELHKADNIILNNPQHTMGN